MADVRIELGRTDGFRYIGIQPPLSVEQYAAVTADEGIKVNLGFRSRVPYAGDCYTEGGFMTDLGQGDEHLVATAHRIADVLRGMGDTVAVDEAIKQIGYGYHLFGGQDRELV